MLLKKPHSMLTILQNTWRRQTGFPLFINSWKIHWSFKIIYQKNPHLQLCLFAVAVRPVQTPLCWTKAGSVHGALGVFSDSDPSETTVQTLLRSNSHFMMGLLWQLLQLLALMSFHFTLCQHCPVSCSGSWCLILFLMLNNQLELKAWSCDSPEGHTTALSGHLQHELQQLGVDTSTIDCILAFLHCYF